jgi:hypothetical protein
MSDDIVEKHLCAFPVGEAGALTCLRPTCGFPTDQHFGRVSAPAIEAKPRPRGRRA